MNAPPERNLCGIPVADRPPSGKITSGNPDLSAAYPTVQTHHRRPRIRLIHRHLSRPVQMPPDERHLPQSTLRQNPKLKRQLRKQYRCVHVAQVIRRVDGRRRIRQILGSQQPHRGEADPQQSPAPRHAQSHVAAGLTDPIST